MRTSAIILLIFLVSLDVVLGKEKEQTQAEILFSSAQSLMQNEKSTRAYLLFQDFIELYPAHPLKVKALSNMAVIKENNQELKDAAILYSKLFEEIGKTNQGLSYLFHQGRLWEIIGEEAKYKTIYQQIIEFDKNGKYAIKAQNRLNLIEALNN